MNRNNRVMGIVPPHILEAIIKSGTAEERERAVASLAADTTLRAARIAKHTAIAANQVERNVLPVPNKDREIFTAKNSTNLPGSLVRKEGQAKSNDAAVDEAYDGLGYTFDLYWNVFKRNSIDNAGMPLLGTVHYGSGYDNAFWNGSQMVFGDGDGVYFNRFTISIDVMGHELTHGVTAHLANLAYHDQPGALNESISDCFGSMVKQYALNQTSQQADWLIGAGLFTPKVSGTALRSMKAPGTAYNDKVLGKDPQPATMSAYVNTTSDNGGVHINSGIPNHAFYLAAIALGGHSWEKAGVIWYATLCDSRLASNAQFQDFANLTTDNAGKLFGEVEQQAVSQAWIQVGITPEIGPIKVSGNWTLHYAWSSTAQYSQVNLIFNSDGTFSGSAAGKWVQQFGTILLSFNAGPAKYAGNIDGNVGTGAMTTFAGLDGCWYLTKQGTIGLAPEFIARGVPARADFAGNKVKEEIELVGVGVHGSKERR